MAPKFKQSVGTTLEMAAENNGGPTTKPKEIVAVRGDKARNGGPTTKPKENQAVRRDKARNGGPETRPREMAVR
jgi:hypothetical protein